jgi:hypothetical protein
MKKKKTTITVADLKLDDVVLYIPCPVLTRIIKKISPRTVFFHDGSTMSISSLNKGLSENKFEITRKGTIIFPS